jgi:hypothetical protein
MSVLAFMRKGNSQTSDVEGESNMNKMPCKDGGVTVLVRSRDRFDLREQFESMLLLGYLEKGWLGDLEVRGWRGNEVSFLVG